MSSPTESLKKIFDSIVNALVWVLSHPLAWVASLVAIALSILGNRKSDLLRGIQATIETQKAEHIEVKAEIEQVKQEIKEELKAVEKIEEKLADPEPVKEEWHDDKDFWGDVK